MTNQFLQLIAIILYNIKPGISFDFRSKLKHFGTCGGPGNQQKCAIEAAYKYCINLVYNNTLFCGIKICFGKNSNAFLKDYKEISVI